MRRRLAIAVGLSSGLALIVFGIGLALVVATQYRDAAVLELEREAARAALAVPAGSLGGSDPIELPRSPRGAVFAVYTPEGSRVLGVGPVQADGAVGAALRGAVADLTTGSRLVVAVPLTSDERVFAALRAEMPASVYRQRITRAWGLMAVFGAGLAGLAAVVTRVVSARLTRPIDLLVGDAERLGSGTFSLDRATTGIAEIDRAHATLADTASRLGELVGRERSFSAEVSHQLRTPLTALRLDLDALDAARPGDENLADALRQLDHLERTVTDMLALARDTRPPVSRTPLEPHLRQVAERWNGPLAVDGRPLRLVVEPALPETGVRPAALDQIVEAVVANAYHHGAGEVTIHAYATAGAVAVDVIDRGPGFGTDDPFDHPAEAGASGHGRGLGLARRLADAEGADLRIVRRGPEPTVRLLLPT